MNLGTAVGYLELDTSKFQSGLKTAQSQFKSFMDTSQSANDRFTGLGNSLKTVGSTLTKNVTLPLTALGTGAVTVAANFEKGMSQVAATMGFTAEEINGGSKAFESLKQAAMDAGAKTQFSASESAEALNYLALAGYDTEKAIATLPTVLNLAAAGGLELGYASDVMTDAMSSLGLSTNQAEKFVDQLAKTSQKSNTNVGQLGEAILTVGGTAKVLAGGTTELNTALGILADNGIKGAEGGTALRNIILALTPTTDKAVAAFKKLGIETYDANGNLKPINETFAEMDGKLKNLSQEERTRVLSDIFNKVDLKAANALLANSGERFDELSGYIANADGAASDMAETMNNNLSGQLTLLKSALEGAGIAIGNALLPVIKTAVEWINNLVNWFNSLSPSIQTAIVVIGGLVAAIGPLLLIIGNVILFVTKIVTAVSTLVTTFQFVNVACALLGTSLAALAAPILLVIAKIAALIAAGVLLYQNWDNIKTFLVNCFEGIKNAVDSAFSWICSKLGADSNQIKSIITDTWNKVKSIISTLLGDISRNISDCWDKIKSAIGDSVGQIFNVIKETWERIKAALKVAGMAINQLINGDWEGAKKTIKTAIDMIKNAIKDGWNKIKEIISSLGQSILTAIKNCWNNIKSYISQAIGNIKTAVVNGWNNLKSATQTAWNNIKAIISTIFNGVKGDIAAKINQIKTSVSNGWNNIKSSTSSILSGIKSVVTNAFNGVVSGITSSLSKAYSTAVGWWNKIKSIFSKPISAIVNIFKKEKSLISPPVNDTTTYTNSLRARENTINDFVNGMNARVYTMYKNSEIDLKLPTVKANRVNNSNSERPIEVNLNIDKFVNKSKEDINEIMDQIAFELRKRKLSYGGAR